jgi:phage terminase large subunit-like protein
MRSPRAKKAASTRTKNARFRADKAKARSAAALSEQTRIAAQAKAYSDMENSVCDLSRAATLAMEVFDKDGLFLFAVGQLDFMVQRFKDRYYAEEFPGDN